MTAACIPVRVIGEDPGDHERRVQVAVDDDDRGAECLERFERRRVVLACQGEDQSVGSPLLEQPHVLGVELWIALGVGEEHRVAGVAQRSFGSLDDLGEELVRDVADDEADRAGLAAAEALREQVGLVPELLDRPANPLAHDRADVGMVGEDAGDRRHGDACARGDLAHARATAPLH